MFTLLYFLVRWQVFGPVPSRTALSKIQNHYSSEIVDRNGTLLGKYFIYDRTAVNLEDISPEVVNALIATEDTRFYRHRGIDMRSLGRVLFKSILLRQGSAGGGSTITQQLAKNLFPRNARGRLGIVTDKLRETIIASRLERVYSKDEILLLYLNTVPFGDNVFGIAAASYRFFTQQPALLKTEQAAVLIGMLKANNQFNPRLFPEPARLRRNTVISQMVRYGFMEQADADSLKGLPLILEYTPLTHIHGPAPYFREWARQQLLSIINTYNEERGTSVNLYTDGLKITTSIDIDLQMAAEEALRNRMRHLQASMDQRHRIISAGRAGAMVEQLIRRSDRYVMLARLGKSEAEIRDNFSRNLPMIMFSWDDEATVEQSPLDSLLQAQKTLHGALVSVEPASGYIRAWVGGNSIRFFQYDNVISDRQLGSSFKPFVYAAALQHGLKPCDYVSNDRIFFPEHDNWSPANSDDSYEGYSSMKGALTRSVNTVAVRYQEAAGGSRVVRLAHQAGIHAKFDLVPSMALGTTEATLLEITSAYSVFSNLGRAVSPRWLIRIEGPSGELIYEEKQTGYAVELLEEGHCRLLTEMLQGVTKRGTASALSGMLYPTIEAAGKTGTTQNSADSWFIGYTPGLVTGVWVGLENPAFAAAYPPPFGASRSSVLIWGEYVNAAFRIPETRHWIAGSFGELPAELAVMLDCEDYLHELPRPTLIERLFQMPDESIDKQEDEQDGRRRRRGLLRRILDEIF